MTSSKIPFAVALQNHRTICGPRGYCGPFENEELYRDMEEAMWDGVAECVHCRNTVSIVEHFERWERSLWTRTFGFEP